MKSAKCDALLFAQMVHSHNISSENITDALNINSLSILY